MPSVAPTKYTPTTNRYVDSFALGTNRQGGRQANKTGKHQTRPLSRGLALTDDGRPDHNQPRRKTRRRNAHHMYTSTPTRRNRTTVVLAVLLVVGKEGFPFDEIACNEIDSNQMPRNWASAVFLKTNLYYCCTTHGNSSAKTPLWLRPLWTKYELPKKASNAKFGLVRSTP